MDMPELIDDPRYRTNSKRCDNADSLDASIAQWFARHDSAVIHDLFDKADVVSGPVLAIEDIFEDDHYTIGRASSRERVCQYVKISVVAVSLKQKLTSQ